MNAGRKPEWPAPIREAIVGKVCDEGLPLQRVIKQINAGTLGEFGIVPLPYATARRWVDREKTKRASNERPDMVAWTAAAERFWRIVGRELDKLERDASKKDSLDPKRLREMLGTLREAKALITVPTTQPNPDGDGKADQEQDATGGFLADLAGRDEQPDDDATDPSSTQPPERGSEGVSDAESND